MEARDKCRQTPIIVAVVEGNVEIVRMLIRRGAEVHGKYQGMAFFSFFLFCFYYLVVVMPYYFCSILNPSRLV